MSTETYKHKIKFLRQGIDRNSPTGIGWIEEEVECTFKELSRVDRSQHKLAMLITSTFRRFVFTKVERKEGDPPPVFEPGEDMTEEKLKYRIKVDLDYEAIYDLTEKYLNVMSVYDDNYTEQVKNEILTDVAAMQTFGMFMVSEKAAPFFRNFLGT